ncbi:MAG: SGNH/GDSL hydrolase family protein [Pyrinomonadaceae bacterium]
MFAKVVSVFLIILFATVVSSAQTTKKRVVFFGDSITELGVKENGYITKIGSLLKEKNLGDKFELIGAGVSGNKIYDLYLRLENDVLSKSPDVVVIFVGVNDIWHKRLLGTGTDYDKFGKFYEALVAKLQNAKIKVVLCTPAVIGERTDYTNEFDGDLNLYSNWIRDFAAKNGLPMVDLRKSFLDYNLKNNRENKPSGILTVDKVHLNEKGNELVAEEILKVLQKLFAAGK